MADVNISKFRAQVVRDGSKPATPGFVVSEGQSPTDPAGSGQNHLPVTIAASSTGLAITESQILGGAGTVSQYIRGDGSLADFPSITGGGSSVSYYLNGSVSQGTIGGVAYKELNRTPVFGAGTDISINADGYIASFITDAGDPNKLEIPAGNWNFETYFSASSSGGSPSFYVELYKYNGSTFTLIASSSSSPELIAFGTSLNPYFSTLAVPQTTLALTDRLAVRFYVNHSGRTITLHTEDNHLCQIITSFTTGLTALNNLTTQVQFFAVGTSGTDFNIASSVDTHTFNIPTASGTNRGALSSSDWTTFNNKENAITAGTTAQYFRGDKTFQTLNTSVVPEGTNLYYTEARVNANTNVAANTAARHNAVTLGTANGLSLSTQVLSLGLASAGVTGALSGTDWSTFNSKQNALTNPVTGTGISGQVAYFNGTTTITSESNLFWDATNDRLGIATSSPLHRLQITQAVDGSYPTLGTGKGALFLAGDTNLYGLYFGINTTDGNGWMQAMRNNNATAYNLILQPAGGNLLVGTTTDAGYKFFVNGFTKSTGYSFNAYSGGTEWQIGSDAVTGSGLYLYNTGVGYSMRLTTAGAATFLSSVTSTELYLSTSNGLVGNINSSNANGGYLTWQTSGTTIADIGTAQQIFGSGGNAVFGINGRGARDIAFGTNNTERLRITSGGNVGIGTTSPLNKLSVIASNTYSYYNRTEPIAVFQGVLPTLLIAHDGNFTNEYAELKLGNNQTTYYPYSAYIRGVQGSGIDQYRLEFGTSASVAATTKMTLSTNGNLGIGTTTPGTKLENVSFHTSDVIPTSGLGGSTTNAFLTQGYGLLIGTTYTVGTAWLQSKYRDSSGTLPMSLQPLGGNVSIGSATDTGYRLYVSGNTYFRSGGNTSASYGLVIQDSGANNLFLVRNDGAATISSTLDTGGRITITADSGNEQFTIRRASNTNAQLILGYHSDGYGRIQAIEQNVAFRPLVLNQSGGNVLIGTTSDLGYKLNVSGNAYINNGTSTGLTIDTTVLDSNTRDAIYLFEDDGQASGRQAISWYNGNQSYYKARLWTQVGPSYAGTTFGIDVADDSRNVDTRLAIRNGNVLINTTTDNGNKLRVNGVGFFDQGVRTGQPVGTTTNNWLLGRALASGTSTPDRWIRVQIGLEYYDILAVYMGTL